MRHNQKVMLTRLEDNSEYNPNSQEIKIKYFDAEAKELKADMILTHHPLIFGGIKNVLLSVYRI